MIYYEFVLHNIINKEIKKTHSVQSSFLSSSIPWSRCCILFFGSLTLFLLYSTDDPFVRAQVSSPAADNGLQTYENANYKFSIQYPSIWTKLEGDQNSEDRVIDVVSFQKDPNTFDGDIYVSVDPGVPLALGTYLDDTIAAYDDEVRNFDLLVSDLTSTLAGQQAYRIVYTEELQTEDGDDDGDDDDVSLKTTEIGTKVGNDVYFITYVADATTFDFNLPAAQKMIESFKILMGTPQTTTPPATTSTPPRESPTVSTQNPTTTQQQQENKTITTTGPKRTPMSTGFKEYTNPQLGIELSYPSDYEVRLPNAAAGDPTSLVVSFVSPLSNASDRFTEYIDVLRSEDGTSPVEYERKINDIMDSIKQRNPTATLSDSALDYTFAGQPGFKFEYTESLDGSLNLRTLNVGAMIDNAVYMISFVTEDEVYAKHLPVVEQMINSFVVSPESTGDDSRESTSAIPALIRPPTTDISKSPITESLSTEVNDSTQAVGEDKNSYLTFVDSILGISLDYPSDWTYEKYSAADGTVIEFSPKDPDPLQSTSGLQLAVENPPISTDSLTLQDYSDLVLQGQQETLTAILGPNSFQILESGPTNLGGNSAQRTVYSAANSTTELITSVRNNVGYFVQYSAESGDEQKLQKMVDSFTIF